MASIPVFDGNGSKSGYITSGIFSPNFDCNIGLGYVNIDLISSEKIYFADHDGEKREVEIVPLPFSSRLEKMK